MGVCVGPDVGSAIEEKVTANPRGGDRLWTGSCELVYVSKSGKKRHRFVMGLAGESMKWRS